jgi:hypothetical protein
MVLLCNVFFVAIIYNNVGHPIQVCAFLRNRPSAFLKNPYGVAVQCNPISFPMLRFLGFLGVVRVNFFFVVFLLESSVCFVFPMN